MNQRVIARRLLDDLRKREATELAALPDWRRRLAEVRAFRDKVVLAHGGDPLSDPLSQALTEAVVLMMMRQGELETYAARPSERVGEQPVPASEPDSQCQACERTSPSDDDVAGGAH